MVTAHCAVCCRNHYICAVHAARLMVARQQGVIFWLSSLGGISYFIDVAYGVGKAGVSPAYGVSKAGVSLAYGVGKAGVSLAHRRQSGPHTAL